MRPNQLLPLSPFRVLDESLGGTLSTGQIGVICAPTGIGKTSFLVQLALDTLFKEQNVLHYSLQDPVDHVRSFYDESFDRIAHALNLEEPLRALVAIERHRTIHAAPGALFDIDRVERILAVVKEAMHLDPALLVLDGGALDAKAFAQLKSLAYAANLAIWTTLDEKRAAGSDVESGWSFDPEIAATLSAAIELVPSRTGLKVYGGNPMHDAAPHDLGLVIDVHTQALQPWLSPGEERVAPTGRPVDHTLVSGGASGAEAAFGAAAQQWGLEEVNFSFEGHEQANTRGRHILSDRELEAGDVSLIYVSRRLQRNYANAQGNLRTVLQSLWHVVRNADEVFVVGAIQEDGTVVGGTGWSVELARMWKKPLWVFDQQQDAWFAWDRERWVEGEPRLSSKRFAGTGTRHLTAAGERAIEQLFSRAFGPRDS
jgi:KaiC/GvpD/RAD55 family RecA-like ATPase